MPPHRRRSPVRPAVLLLAAILLVVLLPASAPAAPDGSQGTGEAPGLLAVRATAAEERAAAAEQRRIARSQERAARQAERAKERAARIAARLERQAARRRAAAERRGAGSGAGMPPSTGSAPAPSRANDVNASARACSPTITASSPRATAGESVKLTGSVVCAVGLSAANQTVVIRESRISLHGADRSETAATTANDGTYSFTSTPLNANTVFSVHVGRRGAHLVVKVAPHVTLAGPQPAAGASTVGDRPRRLRDQATFTGTVDPFQTGALVELQIAYRFAAQQWRTVAYGRVGADGTYSISHGFATPGETLVRAVAYAGKSKVPAASESVVYEVQQPQNPNLTIHASADPLLAGGPLTVSGVAAGAANQQITLSVRTFLSAAPTLTTTSTDGEGNYTFTLSPTENSYLKVTEGSTTSTTLLEHVRLAIAPDRLPSTAKAGEQIDFSGSLEPSAPGRPVVLERENAAGTAFVPVARSTSNSESKYSIPYTPARGGVYTMREKVPGDARNQPSASEPFTISAGP